MSRRSQRKVSKVTSLQTASSTDEEAFRLALRKAQNIVVVAGAGLSAASGVPTFRGAGGLWREYDATALATPEAFKENPALVWQFYQYRRDIVAKAKLNKAHILLARLSQAKLLRQRAPQAKSFHVITQNIDGLSPLASSQLKPSSTHDFETSIIEMHGRLFETQCTSPKCEHAEMDFREPVSPALAAASGSATSQSTNIPLNQLPRCPRCQALARPGVVWFGEEPRDTEKIESLIRKADFCIVIGTSATVFPAAGYAYKVKRHGGTTAVFNLEAGSGNRYADYLFLGPCEETLQKAFDFQI